MEAFSRYAHELQDKGLVKLEGLISLDDVCAAREKVLNLASEYGLLKGELWSRSLSRFDLPKSFRNALNELNRSQEFSDVFGNGVQATIERLVGAEVAPMSPGQQILFTLPQQGTWAVPHDAWHVDLPKFGDEASPGLQAFTFLDDVESGGGATLVVAGSHRLFNQAEGLSSKDLKAQLRQHAFFQHLFDPARDSALQVDALTGRVADVDLQVIELTGKAGDLYLMDLRVLHAQAPNCSDKARLMATCRYPRATIAARFGQTNGYVK